MQPSPPKRARVPATAAAGAATSSKSVKDAALAGLSRLDESQKTAVLEQLIQDSRLSAAKLVTERLVKLDAKPVDLQHFGSKAFRAFHQLDRLRPSQQFEQSGRVTDDIHDLITEAERLNAVNAGMALARIAGVMSHADDTGQVFHDTVASCGGLPYSMAEALQNQLRRLGSPDWAKLAEAYEQLLRVQSRLQDYGIDNFDTIVDEMAKHFKKKT
eukprot:TRINITY_DN62437_c0_g1_i1.p1 TRINITY_DN62437_c0_g1~~TRINITY_DN62437_c0_g1_i1.p1  ORF type:complete len:215 (+),score=48.45 TRINITY_DN62437_c0_g1_i1:109-753(+)